MNQKLFDSMNRQMTPSPQLRATLSEKLARPGKRPSPLRRYVALAACAALVLCAYPAYRALRPKQELDLSCLHSYVAVEGLDSYHLDIMENAAVTGGGEERELDGDMSPRELAQALLEGPYTQEEVEEYLSIGYQMTWAKWRMFIDQQRNSGEDEPFTLDALKAFSQKELAPPSASNTGVLPAGTYIGDAPSQEEATRAYNKLAPYIRPNPDWYGGAYIDDTGTLIVCLVESQDPGDKSLELKVLDWTDNGRVAFSSCKYSLAYLHDLQDKVVDAMQKLGLFSGCGTMESKNCLELTLTSVTDEALALLARLDPDDDAIYVQVGQRVSLEDFQGEDVGTDSAKTEDPAVHHTMPGGVTVPDTPISEGNDPIAEEPIYKGADYDLEQLPDKLPGEERPADTVQSVPQEDGSASTSSFDPNSGFSPPFSGSQS